MSLNYGSGTHVCAEDVEEARRVKLNSSDEIEYADADALGDGVTQDHGEDDDYVAIDYFNKEGTRNITAAGAITLAADVYAAADGKVQALPTAAGTYYKVGKAFEAAAEDGDIIEVLPVDCGQAVTVTE